MKSTALIATVLLTTTVCWSQRPSLPIAPPARPNLPINQPIIVNGNVVTAPSNEPANTMETNPAETNGLAPTNEPGATNPAAMETNGYIPELASAYALTNRLSVMAPAQVLVVRQVQSGLRSLQDVATNINEQEGLLAAIQHDPQIQRRVDEVSDQISNLTRGDVKPSRDSIDRISLDLLRASSHARLPDDHEMILAVVINLTCNSEKLSAADLDDTVNNGVMILHADGVAPAVCNVFGCDLRSVALELQPNLGI